MIQSTQQQQISGLQITSFQTTNFQSSSIQTTNRQINGTQTSGELILSNIQNKSSQTSSIIGIAIGVSIAGICCILISILIILFILKRRKRNNGDKVNEELMNIEKEQIKPISSNTSQIIVEFNKIPKEDIEIEDKIGEGNFGEVFKASWNGTSVALKKLKEETKLKEFIKEASSLAKLNHPNIGKL